MHAVATGMQITLHLDIEYAIALKFIVCVQDILRYTNSYFIMGEKDEKANILQFRLCKTGKIPQYDIWLFQKILK